MNREEFEEYLESIGGLVNGYRTSGDPIKSAVYFEINEGWYELLKNLIDELIAAGWDLTSAANTPVSKTAVTTAAGTFAAGDALALKTQSGNPASYALGTITVVMEWL